MSEICLAAEAGRTALAPQLAAVEPIPETLDKRLVHKSYDRNVLVSWVEAMRNPGEGARNHTDRFRGRLCVHGDHRFFFEHDRGHVSGLYLIEAIRQMSIAIAHLFYDASFDLEFVMTDCSAQFRNVANLHDPIIAEQTTSKHTYRKGRLASMYSDVVIRQRNIEIAQLSGTMVVLSQTQLQYLEQRGA